jgi:hypothetical protein
MDFTERILAMVSAAPDQPMITIAVPTDALPAGFVLPVWVAREAGSFGQALSESLADRPAVIDVELVFPGHAMPVHFQITPRN